MDGRGELDGSMNARASDDAAAFARLSTRPLGLLSFPPLPCPPPDARLLRDHYQQPKNTNILACRVAAVVFHKYTGVLGRLVGDCVSRSLVFSARRIAAGVVGKKYQSPVINPCI